MGILATVIANSVALFLVSQVLSGLYVEGGILTYAIIGVVLTLLNLVVKPILKVLSFPLVFLTGGLFLIVINAAILYLTRYLIVVIDIEGVSLMVDKPLTYVWAAAILGLANWLIHWFIKED